MEDFQEPKALDIQASKLEARPKQRLSVSLNTVRARDALTPRPGIYWQKTGSGRAVGFKKQNADVGQTWHVQIYDPVTRRQVRRSLGTLDEIAGNRQFDEAAKQLTKLIDELTASKSVPSETVKSVCEAYVRKAADAGEASKALDLKSRFVRLVYKDPLGSIELRQLTKVDVEGWRKRLVDRAALVNPRAKKPRYRTRSKSAVNRDMTAIRAALNFAKESDVIESDKAWKLALKPFKSVGGRRELYLTRAQRQAWIEKCAPEARPLLVGLSLLPLRPGALALLTVKAFQEALNVLTVGKDKTGGDRKMRVPPVTSKHLAEYLFRGYANALGGPHRACRPSHRPMPAARRR